MPARHREAARAQEAWPVSGEFIGTVVPRAEKRAGEMFVALVADPPSTSGATHQVRAYLCNSVDFDDWLTGEVAGNSVSLASEGGTTLSAAVRADGARGSFTTAGGEEQEFEATPSTGLSGLYQILVTADRGAFGASARGVALAYAFVDGRLEATFLLPDGRTKRVSLSARHEHPPAVYRTIVREEGPSVWLHGAGRTKGSSRPLFFGEGGNG
jgi:hypothetical protein